MRYDYLKQIKNDVKFAIGIFIQTRSTNKRRRAEALRLGTQHPPLKQPCRTIFALSWWKFLIADVGVKLFKF